MQDAFGRELQVGDRVVYATGRNNQLVYGTVTRVQERVTIVQPSMLSRSWVEWYDERTGQRISPWEHLERQSHYRDRRTGEPVGDIHSIRLSFSHQEFQERYEYVPDKHKEYVRKRYVPTKPVRLIQSDHVFKVELVDETPTGVQGEESSQPS